MQRWRAGGRLRGPCGAPTRADSCASRPCASGTTAARDELDEELAVAARAGWRNDGVSEGSREPRCVPLLPLRLEPATCTSLFPQCSTRRLAAASEASARSESGSRARTTATRSGGGPSAPARTSRASASSSRTRLPRKCPREPHSKRLARQAVAPPRLSRKRAARAMMLAGGSASRTSCTGRAWAQGPCVRRVRVKDRRARSRLCTREAQKVRR